jgi:hypothetical protein
MITCALYKYLKTFKMVVPWHLTLSDKTLQQKLNEKLSRQQRPFIFLAITISVIMLIAFQIRSLIYQRFSNPE